jgi:hypothetical protein
MKMTAPRISRGAKSRVFLYIGAVIFVGITVIIIHETQTRVEDIRKSSEKCQQQQESLAAQLQGIKIVNDTTDIKFISLYLSSHF